MSVSEEAPATGRDTNGRFAKGNAGGPGNPHARKVAQLRAALLERVTVEDIHEMADQLIELALGGSLAAIKLVFQYTLGKPGPMPELPPEPGPTTEPLDTARAGSVSDGS